MDSLTQILVGASVAAVVVPAGHRRAALLAGAILGTLPDLDAFPIQWLTDDPVALMTWHRGVSHSLFVLPVIGLLLWALFRSRGKRVAQAPLRWFWAIQLALITHPIVDAFTVYGTQLFWPASRSPEMWSNLFIIDPLYSIWLLLGVVVAAFAGPRLLARHALVFGLAMSTTYLGWSAFAKFKIDTEAGAALAAHGLQDAPRFSVPMPFNTLLWRVVAMTPDGYVEGERSLVADHGPMRFWHCRSDVQALVGAAHLPAVQRLTWFNRGFMRAREQDGELVLSDLRMGSEPDYSFHFIVAERDGMQWRPIPPRQPAMDWAGAKRLPEMWQRIWEPAFRVPEGCVLLNAD